MRAAIEVASTETIAASYRDITTMMDTDTRKIAAELYGLWTAGTLSDAEFTEALRTYLLVTGASARASADAYAAVLLGEHTIGMQLDADHIDRLDKAATTMGATLDTATDLGPRLERLLAGEALATMQQSTVDAYAVHGVSGYTRGLSATACELCRWLYKDGYVYPTEQPMHKHPGCTCVPMPTLGSAKPGINREMNKPRKKKESPASKSDEAKLAELRARLRAAKVNNDKIDIQNLERLIAKLENK